MKLNNRAPNAVIPRLQHSLRVALASTCVLWQGCALTLLRADTITSGYDSVNRLTNAARSDGSREIYSHDPGGNRLTRVTIAATNQDSQAPSIPSNVAAAELTPGTVRLIWNRSSDFGGSGVGGYIVYLNGIRFTNATGTNILLSGLVPNAAYCATVAAYDRFTNVSAQSSSLCFRLPAFNLSPNPAVAMSIYASAGPHGTSPSWPAYRDSALVFLQNGQNLASDRSQPTNYTQAERVEVGDILITLASNVTLWRGVLNPPLPFRREIGNFTRFGLVITSAIPFNLDGFHFDLESSDPAKLLRGTVVFTNSIYALNRVGLWHGPDGITHEPSREKINDRGNIDLLSMIAELRKVGCPDVIRIRRYDFEEEVWEGTLRL